MRSEESQLVYSVSIQEIVPLIQERLVAGQSVCFSPRGVSMLPMLRQGMDSVVLAPLPEKLKLYDIPLYRRADGTYILHRITKIGKNYTCTGDNQFVPEPGISRDQMIGVVTGFYRGKHFHDVRELGYRLYCRLWCCGRPLRHFARRVVRWMRRKLT